MSTGGDRAGLDHAWFLGASFGGVDDQSERFVREGIWKNGYKDKYLDDVMSIRVGDRVAIKSTYTRKHGLPFDNRGDSVSVMAIKATGIVTDNPGDGRRLSVDWKPLDSKREWYFYTYRGTVWKIVAGGLYEDDLLRFTFDGKLQDINMFRNAPRWREKFGDEPKIGSRFPWIDFYTAFADRLLGFRDDRGPLVEAVHDVYSSLGRPPIEDRFAGDSTGLLRDICPFTTFGLFNRGLTDENRRAIAGGLADALGVAEPVQTPVNGIGVPLVNNQRSWFFPFADSRHDDHIDALWQVFADALEYADSDKSASRERLLDSFNAAIPLRLVGRRLTTGLFWARPWSYPTLDRPSSEFMAEDLGIDPGEGRIDAVPYLELREQLEMVFLGEGSIVHSFPELALLAYERKRAPATDPERSDGSSGRWSAEAPSEGGDELPGGADRTLYSVDDIIDDGCFLPRDRLEALLERLRDKKNLILQGPPGTGKTWLAKRLAYALIGSKSERRVRPFQFHPNLSYEDFVRGWRPVAGGELELTDGPFLRAVHDAAADEDRDYVLVVEEINRGNPAQIFGEMLTLLEADKRVPAEALALSYPDPNNPDERVHIPPNLYVIGTMNVADRSLALVDFALRRRFAFADLEPTFGEAWRGWMSGQFGLDAGFLRDVESRITSLNATIAEDAILGPQFQVGHSVVTPAKGSAIEADPPDWYRQIVETEIVPLLNEYWFETPTRASEETEKLLDGMNP